MPPIPRVPLQHAREGKLWSKPGGRGQRLNCLDEIGELSDEPRPRGRRIVPESASSRAAWLNIARSS